MRLELEVLKYRSSTGSQKDENVIPIFYPSRDNATIDEWLSQIDRFPRRHSLDDNTVIRLISGKLRSHACQWYKDQQRHDSVWRKMKIHQAHNFRKLMANGFDQ